MKINGFLIATALFATLAIHADRSVLSQDETTIQKAGTNGIFDSASLNPNALNLNGLPCRFEASYELEEGSNRGAVRITATPDPGYHVFSITQPDKGPSKTTIGFSSPNVRIVGNLEADSIPEISLNEVGFEGKQVEMHSEPVTWTASIELDAAPAKEPTGIELIINGQLCKTGQCIGIRNHSVEAQFIGYYTSAKDDDRNGPFREPDSLSEWTIELSKNKAKPGETVELIVRGKPDDTYHLYMYDPSDEVSEWRTLFYLKQKGGLRAGLPIANKSSKRKDFGTGEEVGYYEGEVEWKIPLRIPADAIQNYNDTLVKFVQVYKNPVYKLKSDTTCADSFNTVQIYDKPLPLFHKWNNESIADITTYNFDSSSSVGIQVSRGWKCNVVDVLPVRVKPLPKLTMARDTVLCNGQNVTLAVSMDLPGSARWNSNSNSTLNVSNSGNYAATGIANNGCQNIGFTKVAVVNPPAQPYILDTVCAGETAKLGLDYTGTDFIYKWAGRTETTPLINPTPAKMNTARMTSAPMIPQKSTLWWSSRGTLK
jgi:hypothetical protein